MRTLYVDDDAHQLVKIKAAETGATAISVVSSLIRDALAAPAKPKRKTAQAAKR